MTSNSPCASTSPCVSSPCADPIAERPRYFPRQIITPDDLTLEQDYFRNKLRRHNRLMHGWGVVCGAKVCLTPQTAANGGNASYQPWMVTVTAGYILGPYGDEILLDCCRTVDVRTSGTSGITGDPCVQATDPWCTDVFVQRSNTGPLYVAIKYAECKTRPVRVQPVGCGCGDNSCEYSRLHDGYEIGILTSCPDAADRVPLENTLFTAGTPDCPPCPPQPWVVLAAVTIDVSGNVTLIDNCTCRRIVTSFGNVWHQCTSVDFQLAPPLQPTAGVDLQNISVGTTVTTVTATLNTTGLTAGITLTGDLGPGIANVQIAPGANPTQWSLSFDVQPGAALGTRTLVVNSGNSSAALLNAIKIVQKPALKTLNLAPAATPAAEPAAAATDAADSTAADTSSKKKKS
jgi:hypothetical protein